MFARTLPSKLVEELKVSRFWENVVADPDLCPQIRNNSVTVYHRGCGLILNIRHRRKCLTASVHHKYVPFQSETKAATSYLKLVANATSGFEFDGEPSALPLGHMSKEVLKAYKECMIVKPEMDLVHNLILNSGNVILDQEVKFATSGEKTTDRIDLCWCWQDGVSRKMKLVFVEVKRIGDRRLLGVHPPEPPEVLTQLRRYQKRLVSHTDEILKAYQKVVQLKRTLGLGGKLVGIPEGGVSELMTKPLLVIGGCASSDFSRIMSGEGEWAPLMAGLPEVAAGLILCSDSGCSLRLKNDEKSKCYLSDF